MARTAWWMSKVLSAAVAASSAVVQDREEVVEPVGERVGGKACQSGGHELDR
jgi:hypothetical protein